MYKKNPQVDDPKDYNQEILNYASTLIEDHTSCKKYYHSWTQLQDTIDKYMICTLYQGNIDDNGELIATEKPDAEGCTEQDKEAGKVSATNASIAHPTFSVSSSSWTAGVVHVFKTKKKETKQKNVS